MKVNRIRNFFDKLVRKLGIVKRTDTVLIVHDGTHGQKTGYKQ
jgi:hypothetical protein